jgi:SAM-dependent methyltransferase
MKKLYKPALIFCLRASNLLYKIISYLSIKYEKGIHPKHRLIGYHDFFLENVCSTDRVLDIGCGNGALSFDVASKARSVLGVDIEKNNIDVANSKFRGNKVKYIVCDATKDLSGEKFDVIILSNVLEHIDKRVDFLVSIRSLAGKYLIRVPMFDRDWIPLYKKELGIEWRLDLTHFTEFTKKTFEKEVSSAGYKIKSLSVQFGEIWAVVIPKLHEVYN